MSQKSNFYYHMGAQFAGWALYLLLANKPQGYCSFTCITGATALQYIRSNDVNDKEGICSTPTFLKTKVMKRLYPEGEHSTDKPIMMLTSVIMVSTGCLLSRVGLKVWVLSLVYFAASYDAIHHYRPKNIELPPPPEGRRKVAPQPEPEIQVDVSQRTPNKPREKIRERTYELKILGFYRGTTEVEGVTSQDMFCIPVEEFKAHPKALRYLFPTPFTDPMLTDGLVEAFREDESLRNTQKEALLRVLFQLGLYLDEEGGIHKRMDDEFAERIPEYTKQNFSLIANIILSLSHLGQEPLAQELFNCLEGISQEEIEDFPSLEAPMRDYWTPALNGERPRVTAQRELFPQQSEVSLGPLLQLSVDPELRLEHAAKPVLQFYNGDRQIHGRSIDDGATFLWEASAETLEYLQWLFPLSNTDVVPDAPYLDLEITDAFHQSEPLRNKQRAAFMHCLELIDLQYDGEAITKTAGYGEESKRRIAHCFDLVRATIPASLKALGNGDLSVALNEFIRKLPHSEQIKIYLLA